MSAVHISRNRWSGRGCAGCSVVAVHHALRRPPGALKFPEPKPLVAGVALPGERIAVANDADDIRPAVRVPEEHLELLAGRLTQPFVHAVDPHGDGSVGVPAGLDDEHDACEDLAAQQDEADRGNRVGLLVEEPHQARAGLLDAAGDVLPPGPTVREVASRASDKQLIE